MEKMTPGERELAVGYLRKLLTLDTTNPPGNEQRVVEYLETVLEAEGIPYHVVEDAGRPSLVARLGPDRPDGLMLSAHTDVVLADPSAWKVPPFSGAVKDGFVWGRGAIDMKHMLAQSLAVMIAFARRGLDLRRDLLLVAVADEEAGCRHGSSFLVRDHKDLIASRYCLTEVGGFTLRTRGKTIMPVGVATKGFVWVRVVARGKGGHGAFPPREQALRKLGEALANLGDGLLAHHMSPQAADFLKASGGGLAVRAMDMGRLTTELLRLLPRGEISRYLAAITHTTACVTMLHSGMKPNVVPTQAEATVDVRFPPGVSPELALSELRSRLGEGLEFQVLAEGESTSSPYPSPLWNIIGEVVREQLPDVKVVPYVVPGFTDATAYASAGIACYGFTPVVLPEDLRFSELFHGPNERIPVNGFLRGLDMLFEVCRKYCTAR